jgi:hypothetical protein
MASILAIVEVIVVALILIAFFIAYAAPSPQNSPTGFPINPGPTHSG